LAWPFVIVVLAVLFNSQIRALLQKLTSFKGWGLEASFEKQVAALAVEAAALPEPPQTPDQPKGTSSNVATPPVLAFDEAPAKTEARPLIVERELSGSRDHRDVPRILAQGWNAATAAIQRAYDVALPGSMPAGSDLQAARLAEAGVIHPETYSLFETVNRTIISSIAVSNVSRQQALAFERAADKLARTIDYDLKVWKAKHPG
jgi:hypothetical protein